MKRALTGIKPTSGQIHVGNYFGAIKPLLDFQALGQFDIIAFIADLHALNLLHDGNSMKQNIYNLLKVYIACGLDINNILVFKQSDVPAHTQLNWILGAITTIGYMKRMHAFKDAMEKGKGDETTMGTFNYPILMAADILLYDADVVPVGKDQKQHLEFTRDIAQKFNNLFGDTFKLPEPFIQESLATIPGTDGRKMSKSYNNYIGLLEDDNTLLKKVKSIVTDMIPIEDPKDPDACNVYNILKLFLTPAEDAEIRGKYTAGGMSYKYVKDYLYEKLLAFISPIRAKAQDISDTELKSILDRGGIRANDMVADKIDLIYQKVGLKI